MNTKERRVHVVEVVKAIEGRSPEEALDILCDALGSIMATCEVIFKVDQNKLIQKVSTAIADRKIRFESAIKKRLNEGLSPEMFFKGENQ